MSEYLSIGELAKRCGRSVHTIRWYEAQGLIPNVGRDGGGRRMYQSDHVEHLVFLDLLRRTGMSIAEMRELSALAMQGWRTLDARHAMLRAHRARVEGQIEELREALALVDAKLAYYDEWMAKKKRPPAPHAWSGGRSPRAGGKRRSGNGPGR